MSGLERITDFLGAGTFPQLFFPRLRDACDELGATRAILTMGVLEMNRATFNRLNTGHAKLVQALAGATQIELLLSFAPLLPGRDVEDQPSIALYTVPHAS